MKINSILTLYLVSSLRMPWKYEYAKATNDVNRTRKGVCRAKISWQNNSQDTIFVY